MNSEPRVTTALLEPQEHRRSQHTSFLNLAGGCQIVIGGTSIVLQVISTLLIGKHEYSDFYAGIWVGIWLIASGFACICWSYNRQKYCMFGVYLAFSVISIICCIIAAYLFFSITGRYNKMVCFNDWSKDVRNSWSSTNENYENYEEFYEKYYKQYIDGTFENRELEKKLRKTPTEDWAELFDKECRKIEYGKIFYTSLGVLMVAEVMISLSSNIYVLSGKVVPQDGCYHGNENIVVYETVETEFQRQDANTFTSKTQHHVSDINYHHDAQISDISHRVVIPSAPPLHPDH